MSGCQFLSDYRLNVRCYGGSKDLKKYERWLLPFVPELRIDDRRKAPVSPAEALEGALSDICRLIDACDWAIAGASQWLAIAQADAVVVPGISNEHDRWTNRRIALDAAAREFSPSDKAHRALERLKRDHLEAEPSMPDHPLLRDWLQGFLDRATARRNHAIEQKTRFELAIAAVSK